MSDEPAVRGWGRIDAMAEGRSSEWVKMTMTVKGTYSYDIEGEPFKEAAMDEIFRAFNVDGNGGVGIDGPGTFQFEYEIEVDSDAHWSCTGCGLALASSSVEHECPESDPIPKKGGKP